MKINWKSLADNLDQAELELGEYCTPFPTTWTAISAAAGIICDFIVTLFTPVQAAEALQL